MEKDKLSISYRPEIDGLRAVAVLSVIIFHFKKNLLPGGFLGVDIFFVISGYLITSLIIKEITTTKNFSFINFYIRRARRILPVMLFTILLTIITSYFFLLPSEYKSLINSSFFAIFFTSNFYFNFLDQNYWTSLASTKPLLNLWSLSLEEQYYFLFPIFFFIFFNYFRRILLAFCIFVFIISFFISINNSIDNSSSSFYLLHARIWEFIPGSIIAIYQNNIKLYLNNIYKNIFISFGIFFFFISILFYGKLNINIIYYNLLAVSGTCLLIIFLSPGNFFFKILSNKFLVFIGLISFSLYLVHYPLIVIYRSFYYQFNYANHSLFEEIIIVLLLFIISIASYFFIEKRFRNKNKVNLKKFFIYIFITILSIFIISFYTTKKNKELVKTEFHNINIDNEFYSKEYLKKFIKTSYQIKKEQKLFLIIGDSYANNFYMSLKLNKNEIKNFQLIFINTASIKCAYEYYNKTYIKSCNSFEIPKYLSKLINQSNYIYFTKRWNDEDMKYLNLLIEKIKSKSNIIISNGNVPFKIINNKLTPLDLFIIMNKRLPETNDLKELEKKYFSYYSSNVGYKANSDDLKKIALKNNIKFMDNVNFQCERLNSFCYVLSNNKRKLVYDLDHFTYDGAKFYGDRILNSGEFNFLKE